MEEIWETIEEFPDYKVSNLGNVKRVTKSKYSNKKNSSIKLRVNKNGYITAAVYKGRKQFHKLVSRLVYSTFIKKLSREIQIDHIDQNKQNNCLNNLRIATRSQNEANKKKWVKRCSSNYKGVHFVGNRNKWQVRIMINGKRLHLGLFKTEKEAAIAYNNAAIEFFKEFACLNKIEN